MVNKIFAKVIEGEKVKFIVSDNKFKLVLRDEEILVDDPKNATKIALEIINRYKYISDDGWIEEEMFENSNKTSMSKDSIISNIGSLDKSYIKLKEKLKVVAINIVMDIGKKGIYKYELNDMLKFSGVGGQSAIVKVRNEVIDELVKDNIFFIKREVRKEHAHGLTKAIVYPIIARMSEWQKLHKENEEKYFPNSLLKDNHLFIENKLEDTDIIKNDIIIISEGDSELRPKSFNKDSHPLRNN